MYEIFGLKFFSGSIDNAVNGISSWIRRKKHTYVCVTGAHGVVESSFTPTVFLAHQKAELVVPDGMPLVWLGKWLGAKQTERIYGPDLFLALCRRAEQKKWRVFFYGTTEETIRKLSKQLRHRHPALQIAGHLAPPFRPLTKKESKEVTHVINRSSAQIVFVGLSTPKQEVWMHEQHKKLHANVLVGVGAAFDFVAGTKKQAPRWIQRVGLEWLFRFFQEPRRLWHRALVINARFVMMMAKELFFLMLRARGGKVFRIIMINLLLTGLLLGLAELAARAITDRGLISYYHPIQIQTFIDPSAKTEDWRLTHIYRDEQFIPDPLLFWKPKPGAWRYNRDGFVGNVDRSVLREAKERGGCNILAIGDSNTQGITESSWPEGLNELFVINGQTTRVANAGVAGYSSFQGAYIYGRLMERQQSTVVIVSFGWNDMAPDMGMPDKIFSSFALPLYSALNTSRLYLIIRNIFSPQLQNDKEYHPRVSISEYRENLNAIITTTQQYKSTVLLLTRPYNPEHMVWNSVSPPLTGGWRKHVYDYNGVVRDVAKERSVQLIDMEARFSTEAAFFLDDSHFTSEGNSLAAKYIYEQMSRGEDVLCK